MSFQLVAVDLDDTLLDKANRISPGNVQAIREAVARGVTVTVATGRMYSSARPYARQLGLDVPLITYNGALIKAALSGEVLYHRPIEREVAQDVLDFFREQGWYIQTYIDDVLYVPELNEKATWYARHAQVEAVPVGDALYTVSRPPTKMLAMAEPEEIDRMRETVRQLFGDRLYATMSKPTFLEIMHPTVNKGQALDFLSRKLAIPREQVMAVGDSANDLDMLSYAGWGVAMGNASEQVKQAARAVTACHDEDGVAEAIRRYVLAEHAG